MHSKDIYCDFSSSTFDDSLRQIDGNLLSQKHKLLEFLSKRAKDRILKMHPDWAIGKSLHPQALQRLIEINVRIDCTRSLQELVAEYICSTAQVNDEKDAIDEKKKQFLFNNTSTNNHIEREIDKRSYRGGQTKLHVEAAAGNLEEVKRLVEVEKARTDIRDNSGKTAYEYALWMGFADVAEYLRNFR